MEYGSVYLYVCIDADVLRAVKIYTTPKIYIFYLFWFLFTIDILLGLFNVHFCCSTHNFIGKNKKVHVRQTSIPFCFLFFLQKNSLISVEIFCNAKRHEKIIVDGYCYIPKNVHRQKSKVLWYCPYRHRIGCMAAVRTVNRQLVEKIGKHSH